MAKILPFAKRSPVPDRPRGVVSAEIVIFPGIRIEYHEACGRADGAAKPARKARKIVPDLLPA